MSKCTTQTYTLYKINEGRDGDKPQSRSEKRITTNPPEYSEKTLVNHAKNQNQIAKPSYRMVVKQQLPKLVKTAEIERTATIERKTKCKQNRAPA
jgi:hypothetical protein